MNNYIFLLVHFGDDYISFYWCLFSVKVALRKNVHRVTIASL